MPGTSAALSGLAFATNLASEATDGIPVVKQVLAVTSRIVGLAEQIDKNREDLHALADRAKIMDTTIKGILAEREPGDEVLCRLKDMNCVLSAIEKQFFAHVKQGRLRKALGYILTVRKEVERLKGEFDDRLQDLELAATIDTNISVREDSRFIGQFRNIRHCEIDIIRHIGPNCHLATCEGSNQVFVVRDIVPAGQNDRMRQALDDHERILEEMSLIQNRHPVIASLYGRNTGPKHSRFLVLKAGNLRPLLELVDRDAMTVPIADRIVSKLLDALTHLWEHGAGWDPSRDALKKLYLDENYEPKIGVMDELCTGGYSSAKKMGRILLLNHSGLCWYTADQLSQLTPSRMTAWHTKLFTALTDVGYCLLLSENVVRRADIPHLIPLTQASWNLPQPRIHFRFGRPRWGEILGLLAFQRHTWVWHSLRTEYWTHRCGETDYISIFSIEKDAEAISYLEANFAIPHSANKEVMQQLGIQVDGFAENSVPNPLNLEWIEHCGVTPPESTVWLPGVAARWEPGQPAAGWGLPAARTTNEPAPSWLDSVECWDDAERDAVLALCRELLAVGSPETPL